MFKTPQIGGSKKATQQQRGTQSAPTTVSAVATVIYQPVNYHFAARPCVLYGSILMDDVLFVLQPKMKGDKKKGAPPSASTGGKVSQVIYSKIKRNN